MTPSEPFVPLTATPASPSPREFRVAVVNRQSQASGDAKAAQPGGFQAIETTMPVAVGMAHHGEKKVGEPRVTIQRDGDRITHLRIQCGCGQVMDLACIYEPAPAKQ
jgi:hypothetical protein